MYLNLSPGSWGLFTLTVSVLICESVSLSGNCSFEYEKEIEKGQDNVSSSLPIKCFLHPQFTSTSGSQDEGGKLECSEFKSPSGVRVHRIIGDYEGECLNAKSRIGGKLFSYKFLTKFKKLQFHKTSGRFF